MPGLRGEPAADTVATMLRIPGVLVGIAGFVALTATTRNVQDVDRFFNEAKMAGESCEFATSPHS